ncbi:MAG: tripartite tricarboxylate transporter substrate binding protein [Burkholderiales bacterium]
MRLIQMLAAALGLAIAASAWPQAYPAKPVRIVVPFAAGGATDIITRILAQKLTELWGQTVIVEDRGGAAGNIGAAEVAKSTPDGYTLLMTSGSIVTANQHIYQNMGFDPARDLIPITGVASGPQVVVVNPAFPAKTLKELIAMVKAKPGTLNYGHAGIGSQTHLAAENLLYTAGIDMINIPYKGEAPAITDLVAGHINMVTSNLPAAIGFVNQGKLRALAVTSRERIKQLPNVPAAAETLPGFENLGWFGLMAPAGTPKDLVERIHRDTAKVLDTTDMRARLFVQGMGPMINTPEQFTRLIRDETLHWAKIVRERRIEVK